MTPPPSDAIASTPAGVAILGSTGSIGTSALRVLARQRARFTPVALTANGNVAALAEQVSTWLPTFVGLVQPHVDAPDDWNVGAACLVAAATHPDVQVVINAVVGAAGLPATLAALRLGKRVALANKETLVLAGAIVTETARVHGGELVPVDSEHSAILQCLAGRQPHEVRRLVLTASGGPFRTWPAERIAAATVTDALKHPTWQMGSKITIDSATLANKALEVIEAHHLFGVPYDRIDVVVHPQSIIHSFVEFVDGSVLAQMGVPSMELPILYALTYPERVPDSGVPSFDPVALGGLSFETVRYKDFPMLQLGIDAGRRGGAAPAVFNAANEIAVVHFLAGRLSFSGIAERVSAALQEFAGAPGTSLDDLLQADAAARDHVNAQVGC
ncbi:1-deoxy-D-xylulose-5-phosphate reductoisomerase [Gemmatimonas sp.]|uniref:1-deoxy-D-xylulose-5-phosphate reductoisomerase n=1 Tax=Gemmatimonas sp. TaxID=1962908 RepID=UPI003983315C